MYDFIVIGFILWFVSAVAAFIAMDIAGKTASGAWPLVVLAACWPVILLPMIVYHIFYDEYGAKIARQKDEET